jgi:hypothetical protein
MRASKLRADRLPNGDDSAGIAGFIKPDGDFGALLRQSGLSQTDLARRIAAHPNTVSRWLRGERTVPGAVLAYLSLYIRVAATARTMKAMIE